MAGEETTHAAASPETSVPLVGSAHLSGGGNPNLRRAPAGLWPYDTATAWGPWSAFFVTLLIVAVFLAVAAAGGAVALLQGGSPYESAMTLVVFLIAQALMILGALRAATAGGVPAALALALKPPSGGFLAYVKALAIMLIAIGLYTAFTSFVMRHDACTDLGEMAALFRGRWWLLALIMVGIGAPLSEELLFRGYLQSALVPSRLGYWGASLVTTGFWTVLHWGYSAPGRIEVFMIGLIFAWLLRRTGSLRVTLACHAIYNTAIASLLIFAPAQTFGC